MYVYRRSLRAFKCMFPLKETHTCLSRMWAHHMYQIGIYMGHLAISLGTYDSECAERKLESRPCIHGSCLYLQCIMSLCEWYMSLCEWYMQGFMSLYTWVMSVYPNNSDIFYIYYMLDSRVHRHDCECKLESSSYIHRSCLYVQWVVILFTYDSEYAKCKPESCSCSVISRYAFVISHVQ